MLYWILCAVWHRRQPPAGLGTKGDNGMDGIHTGGTTAYMSLDHTNPPHPHHTLFDKFKLGFIKCNNLLNTHRIELVHCDSNLLNWFKYYLWGWDGFVWSPMSISGRTRAVVFDLIITILIIHVKYIDIIIIIICVYIYIYVYMYIHIMIVISLSCYNNVDNNCTILRLWMTSYIIRCYRHK